MKSIQDKIDIQIQAELDAKLESRVSYELQANPYQKAWSMFCTLDTRLANLIRKQAKAVTMVYRLKRYKSDVGKFIGGSLYVHKDYTDILPQSLLKQAMNFIPEGFEYTVVKYTREDRSFSFIESTDFDTADEPLVGKSVKVNLETGKVTLTNPPKSPFIYHHKWMFVRDDYQGFNIEESMQRTRHICSIPDIDYTRIGKLNYWTENVLPRLS